MYDYHFQATMRQWSGGSQPGSRYFVTLPISITQQIRQNPAIYHKIGGSIPVQVRIAYVQRNTSIFLDHRSDSYLLPIKAQIRKNLQLDIHTLLTFDIILLS